MNDNKTGLSVVDEEGYVDFDDSQISSAEKENIAKNFGQLAVVYNNKNNQYLQLNSLLERTTKERDLARENLEKVLNGEQARISESERITLRKEQEEKTRKMPVSAVENKKSSGRWKNRTIGGLVGAGIVGLLFMRGCDCNGSKEESNESSYEIPAETDAGIKDYCPGIMGIMKDLANCRESVTDLTTKLRKCEADLGRCPAKTYGTELDQCQDDLEECRYDLKACQSKPQKTCPACSAYKPTVCPTMPHIRQE